MSERQGQDDRRRGIEIPEEVAAAAAVPEDLNADALGPYTVPSLRRRRQAGWYYVGGAALTVALAATTLPDQLLVTAGLMLAIGAYHMMSAWEIRVSDAEALDRANHEIGFSVGHASAAMSFEGWRARPMWNVLVFSSDDPPSERGLVRIDALDGAVREMIREANAAD